MDPWSPSGGGQQARSLRFILPDRSVVIELVKSFRQIHDNEISQSRHNVEADAEKRVLGRRRAAGGRVRRFCADAGHESVRTTLVGAEDVERPGRNFRNCLQAQCSHTRNAGTTDATHARQLSRRSLVSATGIGIVGFPFAGAWSCGDGALRIVRIVREPASVCSCLCACACPPF